MNIRMLSKIKQAYLKWNWLLMLVFFVLTIFDFVFGILALLCIIPAFAIALKTGNKKFCARSCPRGNFLGKILRNFNINFNTPQLFYSKTFKNGLFATMFLVFIIALIKTGGEASKMGFVFFRFILSSTIVGLIVGTLFKPRSWCQICPLGQGTKLAGDLSVRIDKVIDNNSN